MGPRIAPAPEPVRRGGALRAVAGFTLIELIVVLALISILLFFSMPRFQGEFLQDSTQKAVRWVMHTVKNLRQDAVKHRKTYILHIDPGQGAMWVSDESMTEEDIENASKGRYEFPDHMTIADVAFPDGRKSGQEQADVRFYPKGYSDRAVIHIRANEDEQISLLIEPFLANIKVYDTYVDFEK